MGSRGKPPAWRCRHNYPILVESVQGGKRARCLGCGQAGPVGPDAQQARADLLICVRHDTSDPLRPKNVLPLHLRPLRPGV